MDKEKLIIGWIHKEQEDFFECPKCGFRLYAEDMDDFNYCPYCGNKNNERD